MTWVLVPLGNPGDQYVKTRHNLGRYLLDHWIQQKGSLTLIKKYTHGSLWKLSTNISILVPATYMNLSGQCVKEIVRYGVDLKDLIVLHDDKDLDLGAGRLREEGSDGGHNGVKSIIEEMGTDVFNRLRLGIAPFSRPLDEFVLGSWSSSEMKVVEGMYDAFDQFMKLLESPLELAKIINQVNTKGFWGDSRA